MEQGLNDEHFDAVMENLGSTLVELEVPEELILEAAVVAESFRDEVLNKGQEPEEDQLWKGWTVVKSCPHCEDFAILQDPQGRNRVMLAHSGDCPSHKS